MAIPLTYNLRNLVVRKTTTVMTALGIALTVAVLVAVLALVKDCERLSRDGNPLQRAGDAQGRNCRKERRHHTRHVRGAESHGGHPARCRRPSSGVARTGNRDQSPSRYIPTAFNITLRGIEPVGLEIREEAKLVQGRWFRPGQREVVVGKSIAAAIPTRDRHKLQFGKGEWQIVGIMDAGQGATNSEIYGDLNQATGDFDRAEGLSSAFIRSRGSGERAGADQFHQ